MKDHKPRWMKISRREEPFSERRKKSQHYTPKKSEHSSIEENGGMHEIVKELSNLSAQGSNQLSLKQGQSEIEVPSLLSVTPRKKGKIYSQSSNEMEQTEEKKRSKPTQLRKPTLTEDIEGLFKYYLVYVESFEKDFEAQKIQIDKMLLSQYERIKEIRNFIIDTFALKKTHITSRPLKKLISNRQMEKEKPEKKSRPLARGFSQRKSSEPYRRSFEVENPQSQLGSWKSNEFSKIFQALKQLKIDLNECREIRENENFGRNRAKRYKRPVMK